MEKRKAYGVQISCLPPQADQAFVILDSLQKNCNMNSISLAATMKKTAAEDVNITFEDQQKINKFAWNTSRITELKEEIEVKKKQLQNLEDACDDIMLAEDDCLMIPYQIGDDFISHSQEETQEMLEEAKKNLQEEIDALESRVESIQQVLADLKVQLYAKFGSNINLEAAES
nr:prefoldin subunit 4 [Dasypus novemcinctus]